MSQDANLFSARRPREALGTLSNNVSAIPMPSSAMKRASSVSHHQQLFPAPNTVQHRRSASASRMSLMPNHPIQQPRFQRASSGLSDLGGSVLQRPTAGNLFASSNRRSLAPGALMGIGSGAGNNPFVPMTPARDQSRMQDGGGNLRRSSVFQGRSSSGVAAGVGQSFFATAPAQVSMIQDPRDLRSPATKARCYEELMVFLGSRSFDTSQVGDRLRNSPHSRDFDLVFQFIHNLIDPHTKVINRDQVMEIMKDLRYPYAKSISKSQISAISSNNWHLFLGLLHWMTKLVTMMENFDKGVYDDVYLEAGYEIEADRITFEFVGDGYRQWIEGDTDDDGNANLEAEIERMTQRFREANALELEHLRRLEDDCRALQIQLDEMGQLAPRIAELDAEIRALSADRTTCEQWLSVERNRNDGMAERNAALRETLTEIERELTLADEERLRYQKAVDDRGIAIADIDRMNNDRIRLTSGNETAKVKLAERLEMSMSQETEVHKRLEELKEALGTYNKLCWEIEEKFRAKEAADEKTRNSAPVGRPSRPSKLELKIPVADARHPDVLLADAADNGYQAQHILSLPSHLKDELVATRKEISQRRNVALEQELADRDLLHKTQELMEAKQAEVEKLTHAVTCAKQGYQKEKEITTAQKDSWEANIEKMEKQVADVRLDVATNAQSLEQQEMSIGIEYEQLKEKATQTRKTMAAELERMLNDVVQFKLHIQSELEKYEEVATLEAEKEIAEQDVAIAGTEADDA